MTDPPLNRRAAASAALATRPWLRGIGRGGHSAARPPLAGVGSDSWDLVWLPEGVQRAHLTTSYWRRQVRRLHVLSQRHLARREISGVVLGSEICLLRELPG